MKKLLVFLFIVLLLCGANLTVVQNLNLKNIFPDATIEIYTSIKTDGNIYNKIDNGVGEIIFCDMQNVDYILNSIQGVSGLTFKFSKADVVQKDIIEILQASSCDLSNFGLYGWSSVVDNLLNFSTYVNQKKCNFQLFEDKTNIFLGIPLLLGSY